MTVAHPRSRRVPGGRLFYGWAVVAAVFVLLTVSAGLGFYNVTVYLRALIAEQGFSLGATSAATAMFFCVNGVAGVPVARLLARYDPRTTITAGALLGSLALALLGRVTELWQLYAVYTLFGAGFAASSLVPGTTIVTRWFARRRALALSIASTGISVGGIVVTPLSAALINRYGLGTVMPWLAGAYLAGVVPVAWLVLRPDPAARGLEPDGDPAPPAGAPAAPAGTAYRDAVSSRFFAAVTAAYVLLMFAQVGGIAHLFNLVSERRGEPAAALAVSVLAASSLAARLAGGVALGRWSATAFTLVLAVLQGIALAVVAAATATPAVLAGAVIFGVTVGNLLMLHPLLLAEAFGVRDFARVYARSQLVATAGIASGPLLVGAIAGRTGGYTLALALAALASAAGAAVLAWGGQPRRDPAIAP